MNNRTKNNTGDRVYKHRDDLISRQSKSYSNKTVIIGNRMIQKCFYPINKLEISQSKDPKYWLFKHTNALTISDSLFNPIESGREDVHPLSRDLMVFYKWAFKFKCNEARMRTKNVVSDSSTRNCCSVVTSKLMNNQELDIDWFLFLHVELKTVKVATRMMPNVWPKQNNG